MTPDALAIIPARGGSKRIPRKNIKMFCGKPIIEYSIETALASGVFSTVMVSTDDVEIANVATQAGATSPWVRSESTSGDHSMLADVLREEIINFREQGSDYVFVCCILPTSPFTTVERLKAGYEMLKNSDADSVIPVCKFSYPIQRASRITSNGRLEMFHPENYNARSQDLEPAYHDCGQFYWIRTQRLLDQMRIYADHTLAVVVPEAEVQDIDTPEDWVIAEMKYRMLKGLN